MRIRVNSLICKPAASKSIRTSLFLPSPIVILRVPRRTFDILTGLTKEPSTSVPLEIVYKCSAVIS